MNRARLAVGILGTVAAAALLQTRSAPSPPLAGWFPPGPALYLEVKDFAGLLSAWNSSAEKKRWLESANYQTFTRSRLYARLRQAQAEYAAAAGLPVDMNLTAGVAGAESALAIYDIGQLEFLYVSRLPAGRALETAFWRARERFEPRSVEGTPYYVKTDPASGRVAAFAIRGDVLFLATREPTLAGALRLAAVRTQHGLLQEAWFERAARAAGEPGDLRMVFNMTELVRSPYFRSYWIQRNVSVLRPFAAGVADLRLLPNEVREDRILLRSSGDALGAPDEAPLAEVLALAGDSPGFYRAILAPQRNAVVAAIRDKIFGEAAAAATRRSAPPEQPSEGASTSAEADLETRIDEPPFVAAAAALQDAPLNRFFETRELRAKLELCESRESPGGAFVAAEPVIVLLGAADWDAQQARTALSEAASSLWGVEFGVAARGRLLAIARRQDAAAKALSGRSPAPAQGASYVARYNHAREFPHFVRLMRLLDAPPFQADPEVQPAPPFFSANLASLGDVLRRVQEASIVVRDTGGALRQQVVYRISP